MTGALRRAVMWLLVSDNGTIRPYRSHDDAWTWHELNTLSLRDGYYFFLTVSPDGRDAWLPSNVGINSPTRFDNLSTGKTERPSLPGWIAPYTAAALNGGGLIIAPMLGDAGIWWDESVGSGFVPLGSGVSGAGAGQVRVLSNGTICTHALCKAHILREATGIGEFDSLARTDGWTEALVNLLGDAHRRVAHWRGRNHTSLPPFKLDDLSARYDPLVARALTIHPARSGRQTPARNLTLRLRDRKTEFLRFATDFTVAFSNNVAEQAVRMVKSKTRVSGGFRTLTDAQTFLAIRGYISTIRKNGLRAATELHNALLGNPWMPPTGA